MAACEICFFNIVITPLSMRRREREREAKIPLCMNDSRLMFRGGRNKTHKISGINVIQLHRHFNLI
jgi:hypothetical protein